MEPIERFSLDLKTSIRLCAVMQCRLIAHLALSAHQLAPLESALAQFRLLPEQPQLELLTELMERFETAIAHSKERPPA